MTVRTTRDVTPDTEGAQMGEAQDARAAAASPRGPSKLYGAARDGEDNVIKGRGRHRQSSPRRKVVVASHPTSRLPPCRVDGTPGLLASPTSPRAAARVTARVRRPVTRGGGREYGQGPHLRFRAALAGRDRWRAL